MVDYDGRLFAVFLLFLVLPLRLVPLFLLLRSAAVETVKQSGKVARSQFAVIPDARAENQDFLEMAAAVKKFADTQVGENPVGMEEIGGVETFGVADLESTNLHSTVNNGNRNLVNGDGDA